MGDDVSTETAVDWRQELAQRIAEFPSDGYVLGDTRLAWAPFRVSLGSVSEDKIWPVIGCVNASEFAGKPRGTVMLQDFDRRGDQMDVVFGVRRIAPWNVFRVMRKGNPIDSELVDSAGNPAYMYADFEAVLP